MLRRVSRGGVYFYNFGEEENKDGSVECKTRPCVIVSNDENNTYSSTVIVAPITTRSEKDLKPWQAYFRHCGRDQIILCEQLRCVNVGKLIGYKGQLDEITMSKVDEALALQLNLNVCEKELNANEFIKRLDLRLDAIINSKLEKDKTAISNMIVNIQNSQKNQEKLIESLINKIPIHDYNKLTLEIINLKKIHDENKKSLNNIITSLIGLYDTIDKNENDLVNIGDNIISYNSETIAEIKNDFSNKDTNMNIKSDFNDISKPNMEIYETRKINADNLKHGLNLGTKHKTRWERFDYTVTNALAFIDEWNNSSMEEMCKKYNVTHKQLSSRKYLICQWLVSQNIEFKVISKAGKRKSKSKENKNG